MTNPDSPLGVVPWATSSEILSINFWLSSFPIFSISSATAAGVDSSRSSLASATLEKRRANKP